MPTNPVSPAQARAGIYQEQGQTSKQITAGNWRKLVERHPSQIACCLALGIDKAWLRKQAQRHGLDWSKDCTPLDRRPGALADDLKKYRASRRSADDRKRYREAQDEIIRLRRAVENVTRVSKHRRQPIRIEKKVPGGHTEAAAVGLLSDVHFEQRIRPETIHFLNEYSPDVARRRLENFFRGFVRLYEIERNGVRIPQAVLYLLGDMIHGRIHDEYNKTNTVAPPEGIYQLLDILSGGISFTARYFRRLTVICHVGNHGRTTDKVEVDAGIKESWEWLLYKMLQRDFKARPNIEIIIPESNIYYHQIFDRKVRSLHGNFIRFSGGVGGITIPVNKAIAQWDKSLRADYTIFGHWHQRISMSNFECNASVCGYDPYAESIKAEYSVPSQSFILIDTKHGKQSSRPIFLEG